MDVVDFVGYDDAGKNFFIVLGGKDLRREIEGLSLNRVEDWFRPEGEIPVDAGIHHPRFIPGEHDSHVGGFHMNIMWYETGDPFH